MALPIDIHGARQNNLQNLHLTLPSHKLIVLCGPSGSGKSSLAYETLFAESQRRFIDCLSAKSRQGMPQPEKPDIDSITGLPPALCLEQNVRAIPGNVLLGGITEILDYLRILYAAIGIPHDPDSGVELIRKSSDQIIDELLSLSEGTRLVLMVPVGALLHQDLQATLGDFLRQGFLRLFWAGEVRDIEELSAETTVPGDAALVVDRLIIRGESSASRLADSLQTALRINEDEVRALVMLEQGSEVLCFHTRYRNPETGYLLPKLTPKHFSYFSPQGWCMECKGTGKSESGEICEHCHGSRLSALAEAVTLPLATGEFSLSELLDLPLEELGSVLSSLHIPESLGSALRPLMSEVEKRIRFLNDLGLGYLCLSREANTLSGGELQRARLASQLGGGLSGVLYILDEPTAGLHPADTERLIRALYTLRDLGNTVLVVEHDEQVLRAADYLVDMGPGAGVFGGQVLAQGTVDELVRLSDSPTGQWLSGHRCMPVSCPSSFSDWLVLRDACKNNLHHIELRFPLGSLTCISGPSGSGKSTLVRDCLIPALKHDFSYEGRQCRRVENSAELDRLVFIDQSPIGKSPRATPATTTGLLNVLRPLFAQLPLSKQRGYTSSRFSPNVRGGRCERCLGTGVMEVDMNFLGRALLPCDACHGACFNRETLEVTWKGKSIAQVLAMSVDEAYEFFASVPKARAILGCMKEAGLGYLNLDRRAQSLSGGESQRVKIATELAKIPQSYSHRGIERTLFILDEPTTGLHFHEVELLLKAIFRLRDVGHTVLCIEHHRDLLNAADYLVDMGPGAGKHGGYIVATGTPQEIRANPNSVTGSWLH